MNARTHRTLFACCLVTLAACVTAHAQPATRPATQPTSVRCAIIGGMMETDFWPSVAARFEQKTGVPVELVASGPKEMLDTAFRKGGVDLVVMHASDTILNLVADGFASDPQPWVRNDMVIIGPPEDPAGIKGEPDAAKALVKIGQAKAPFVVHGSAGAQEVLRALMDNGEAELDPDHTTVMFDDRQRRVLGVAAAKKAYTLVGRIPFRSGKLPNDGLAVMVQGDPNLRRPFLVAVAESARVAGARTKEARLLAAFLRSPETQAWIAGYGKGRWDDQPLFFPVVVPQPATRPVGAVLVVEGGVSPLLAVSERELAAMTRAEVTIKDRSSRDVVYAGVPVQALFRAAGVPLGEQLRGEAATLYVVVEASDGYKASFSLAELDPATSGRTMIVADRRDGRPMDAAEGPLRLVVPGDLRPVRSVRQVVRMTVRRP